MHKEIALINRDITVIVPAAGNVSNACNYKIAQEDPGFLHIGNSLAIEEIQKKINKKISLIVRNKNKSIYRLKPYRNVETIEIGDTRNIIDTIKESLEVIDTRWCLINPITTVPVNDELNSPSIEFGVDKIPKENWSSFDFDELGSPIFFSKLDSNSEGILSFPFTGRIFAKKTQICFAIERLKDNEKFDLIYLAKKLYEINNLEIKYTTWLDIGHIATYPSTRISKITSRFFNDLIYEKSKNIIRKKSFNKLKIDNEINFYKHIPNEIKRYFPNVLNVEINRNYSSYEMDYICKPNLSEIFLFCKLGPNATRRILISISRIFDEFYKKDPLKMENINWLYSKKTESRRKELEKFLETKKFSIFKEIYFNDFSVNNINLPSLAKTFNLISTELRKFEIQRPLHFGHGDLCFNNILVDPIYGNINLIDPRADKYKNLDIYGMIDGFYDLSKLNHSIEGLYDSVISNLFSLKIFENKKISFELYRPYEYEIFNDYFKEIFLNENIDKDFLRFLTGNLFLSMLPLHIEDEERMIGLAIIGNILINGYRMEKLCI